MNEQNMDTTHKNIVQIGDTVFVMNCVFGNEPLDDILADFVCSKIKEEADRSKAAA